MTLGDIVEPTPTVTPTPSPTPTATSVPSPTPSATPSPLPEPFAHWTFDDGTGTDSSGNGHNGIVNGAVAAAGQVGAGALEFDGTDDYVDAGNLDVPGSEVTVAAWINSDHFSNCGASDCRILSKATGTTVQAHYLMLSTIKTGNKMRLRFRLKTGGSTTTVIASSGDLVNGQWHHVAATYDGSRIRLFVDGVEVGAKTTTGSIDVEPSVPLWIGANPPVTGSRPWDGKLDDVRLYDVGLSSGQIWNLWDSTK